MELAESGVGYHWDGLFVGASQFYKKGEWRSSQVWFFFCGPFALTKLHSSFCMSFYGCALWSLESGAIKHLDVCIKRHIWSLLRNCHIVPYSGKFSIGANFRIFQMLTTCLK